MGKLIFADHAGMIEFKDADGHVHITIPVQMRRRGGRKEMIVPDGYGEDIGRCPENRALVVAVVRAHTWTRLMETGAFASIEALATRVKMEVSYVRRIMKLANLAPDIVQAILDGNEPGGLTMNALRKGVSLLWEDQRERFGFQARN